VKKARLLGLVRLVRDSQGCFLPTISNNDWFNAVTCGYTMRVPIGAWTQRILTIGVRLNANFRFKGMVDGEAGEDSGNIR